MRLVLFLLVVYLIAAHWLGWWLAFAVVAGALVLLSLLAAWLGRGKAGAGDSPGMTEAAADVSADEAVAELKPAIKSLEEGAFQLCFEQALPHVDDPRPMAKADALRLCALAWSGLEDYAQALPYWERLADVEGSPSAWLNVATTRAMVGAFERADEAFARMQELHDVERGAREGTSLFMPMQTANYLTALDRAGRPDLAMPYLERLADFYRSLHITDSTFLHMRQMPFFHVFLENALPIVRKLKSDDELRSWYRAIYDDVDDEGKRMFATCGVPH